MPMLLQARIKQAGFPVQKDLDAFDFSAAPGLSKPKILELARCGWIDQRQNCCLLGSSGTGKTHLAIALGLAACRLGKRVRFFTAATLVNRLEETQKQYQLDRFLKQLDKLDLLDLRRARLSLVQSQRSGTVVPGIRRSLRAVQPARSPATCRSANGSRCFKASG